MSAIVSRSLCELAQLVNAGKASCREIVEAFLDRCDQLEARLGAFVSLRRQEALREAEAADRLRAQGEVRSPWHGLPLAVKEILVSPDLETSCGSRILRGFRAPYESTVLGRVREAGMVVIGTTNMDEFAMGSSCENSAHRATANPWDLSRVPGGSSGGSAAAVAAREVPVALGSDTGLVEIAQPSHLAVESFDLIIHLHERTLVLQAVLFQLQFDGAHIVQLLGHERFVAGNLELQRRVV